MNKVAVSLLLLYSIQGCIYAQDDYESEDTEMSQLDQPEQMASGDSSDAVSWQPGTIEEGLTTLDEHRGNWLFKREILKKARGDNEKSRSKAGQVSSLKKDFVDLRTSVDEITNNFYVNIGFQQGELDERIDVLVQEIERKKTPDKNLAPEEQQFLAELQEKKKEVEELKKNFSVIQEIEQNLNKMLSIALEQVDTSRGYEQKSWENYDKISEVLSDEVAQRLHLEMQGFIANIDAIFNYLSQELLPYGEANKTKIIELTEKLQASVEDLKKRGVLLEKRIEQQEQKDVKPVKVESKSWFSTIISTLVSPFSYIYNVLKSGIQRIVSLFVSTPAIVVTEVGEPAKVSPVVLDAITTTPQALKPELSEEIESTETIIDEIPTPPAIIKPEPSAPIVPADQELPAPDAPRVAQEMVTPAVPTPVPQVSVSAPGTEAVQVPQPAAPTPTVTTPQVETPVVVAPPAQTAQPVAATTPAQPVVTQAAPLVVQQPTPQPVVVQQQPVTQAPMATPQPVTPQPTPPAPQPAAPATVNQPASVNTPQTAAVQTPTPASTSPAQSTTPPVVTPATPTTNQQPAPAPTAVNEDEEEE